MRHPWRRRCGLALCWFLASSLAAAWPVRADETVALAFNWPSGLRGEVTFSARMTRTVDGRSEALDMSGSYDFVTSAAADGLLIRFENVETDVENAGSGPEAMVKRLMAKVISMPPSYVVSPEGQFLRIEGLEAFRSGVLAGIDEALAELPSAPREQVTQALGTIVTREQLEAGLASDWDSHVGTWIGAELNQGELYELAFNQPIPAFGNMEVPIRTTFRFTRRVACNAAELTERCVELEMHSFVDPEPLAAAIEAFVARMAAGQPAPRFQDLHRETVMRLISEPDTLLPHLMESSTRTLATLAVGGATQVSSRIEQKRFVYTY